MLKRILVTTALSALIWAGCFTVAGKDGNFTFQFVDANQEFDFWAFTTPVAVGTSVDIRVVDNLDNPVDVQDVTPDKSGVVTLGSRGVGVFTLSAASAGRTELLVESSSLRDRIDLNTAEIATIKFSDPTLFAINLKPYVFATGGVAQIPTKMKDATDRTLIGYGLDGFSVSPATRGTAQWPAVVGIIEVAFTEAGMTQITHALAEAPLDIEVVDRTEIASLEWVALNTFIGAGSAATSLTSGKSTSVFLRAMLADTKTTVLGLDGVVTVASTDTTVCVVKPLAHELYQVTGRSVGSCSITATLGTRIASHNLTITAPAAQ